MFCWKHRADGVGTWAQQAEALGPSLQFINQVTFNLLPSSRSLRAERGVLGLPGLVIPYLLRMGSQLLNTADLASVYLPASRDITCSLSLPRTFPLEVSSEALLPFPLCLFMGCIYFLLKNTSCSHK